MAKKSTKKPEKSNPKDIKFLNVLNIAARSIADNRMIVLRFFGLYFLFYLLFVRALSQVDVGELRDLIDFAFGENASELSSNVLLTGTIFGLSLELNDTSSIYATILFVLFSLAFIWVLRYYHSGKSTTLRRAFYEGMYPLIPVLSIMAIMIIELLPLAITSSIVGIAYANGLPTSVLEHIFFGLLLISGFVISGYFLIRSIVAVYVASVPKVKPLEAIRLAAKILKKRRFTALLHGLLFTIITLIAVFSLLLVAVIIKAEFAIFAVIILSILGVPWMHSFFYAYYRQLIDG